MKRLPLILLASLCALLLQLTSCSEKVIKTEYTNVIPANTKELTVIDVPSIAVKAGVLNPTGQSVLPTLLAEGSPALATQLASIAAHPEETGIDWQAPVYLFNAPSLHCMAATLKVNDLPVLNNLLQGFAQENLCSSPQKAEGYRCVEMADIGVGLAYNDGTLLVVLAGSEAEWKKLQSAVTALMKQPAEKSFHSTPQQAALKKRRGDLRLLTTSDALPLDLRSLLKWPHGTQLSGDMQFEKGRIYATLQQADFEGETHESSQPFHPQNDRELQQALMAMTRGGSYNVELTCEELLTLTNLRALMEFTPDDPEIRSLYQLVTRIKSLNLRGDGNRCNATLVLQDQSRNALKQLMEFAGTLAGI